MKSGDWDEKAIAKLRSKINDPEAQRAFDLLVEYGDKAVNLVAGPGGHGYIKDFRYSDRSTNAQPFAFTTSKKYLLFYVRSAGVAGLHLVAGELKSQLGEVQEDGVGQIKIRISSPGEASVVVDRLLSRWKDSLGRVRGIPDGMTKADLEDAVLAMDSHRVADAFGPSRRWDVVFQGRSFAPKRLIGVAARRLAGRVLEPSDFTGGEDSKCHKILEELGGRIVPKGDRLEARDIEADVIEATIRAQIGIPETEREQLVSARRGQGRFRRLLAAIEGGGCRVTGVDSLVHLRASHMKPWKDCSNEERLDGNNGLLLAPHIDHLFDQGFISFNSDGTLLFSPELDSSVRQAWGIDNAANPRSFNEQQLGFLEYHRDHVFRREQAET